MAKIFGSLVFLIVFLIQFGCSEIIINDVSIGDYNVMDEIPLSFSLRSSLPLMDYVEVFFVCDGERNMVFKEYVNFVKKSSYDFNVYSIAKKGGECYYEVIFGDEVEKTNNFNVISELDIEVYLNSKVFMPGEIIYVNGEVKKLKSIPFNYSVSLKIGDFFNQKFNFNDSDFLINFSLSNNIESGVYDIVIVFEERDLFGNVINQKAYSDRVSVLSKPSLIQIDCLEEFNPPEDLNIKVQLLDQSGNLMNNESILLKIFDLNNNLFYQELVKSGDSVVVSFKGDSSLGGWRINAFYSNLSTIKPIYVAENREIFIDFVNGTSYFKVSNLGNVPYEGVVLVNFLNDSGNFSVPFNVYLDKGIVERYELDYGGNYNLSVEGKEFRDVLISGAVVSTNKTFNPFFLTFFLLVFFFLILFLFVLRSSIYKFKKVEKDEKKSVSDFEGGENLIKNLDSSHKVPLASHDGKNSVSHVSGHLSHRGGSSSHDGKSSISHVSGVNSKNNILSNTSSMHSSHKSSNQLVHDSIKKPIHSSISQPSHSSLRGSIKSQNNSNDKLNGERDFKSASFGAQSDYSKVYALFFKDDVSKISDLLLKDYGLHLYKRNNLNFVLLKSKKSLEEKMIKLAQFIINKTENKSVFIHSTDFKSRSNIFSFFNGLFNILKFHDGILVSDSFHSFLDDKNKQYFSFFKSIYLKEKVIKLFKLD